MKRLLLVLCFSMVAAQAAPVKVTEIEGVSEYRLDNGLKVLLAPDVSKPTITVNVTYLVGSRHEGYGETGMAHLLEHLLFKGTPTIPNLPQELSRRGMRPNGSTSYDRTNYFETFAANDEYLEWALGMEADRMVNAFVAEKDLRSEMTVVRNEMERNENSPSRILMEKTLAATYQWHAYGRGIIGARSDVENVRIPNLQAFYRQYYQPDNAALIVAGKFDVNKTLALIEKTFGIIPKPQRVLPPLYTVEPPQEGERSVKLERLGENRMLSLVYHVPSAGHVDSIALDIFMQVMSDTPSGRLHKALVESGKATSVYAWSADLYDPGYVYYAVQMRKQDSPDVARRILLDTLEGVAAKPITDEEVETARRAMLVSFENIYNDSGRLAMSFSSLVGQGDWRLFFWQRDQFAKVTTAEVNRVAQQYYRAANRTLGEFAPVEVATRVEVPARPDLAVQLNGYTGKGNSAAGEAFDPSPDNIEARTQHATLKNGMRLALLPKKTRGATVQASVWLNFGSAESLRGQSEVSLLTGAMLMRGTQKHNRDEIARELDRLKSQIYISGSGSNVSVTVESVRENLPATLRLLREMLREPAFPQSEFEQMLKQMRAGIESARVEPDGVSDQAQARHFNNYQPDDVRYAKSFDEQLRALDALKLDDLRRFHARFYGADHAQFAVVGDFDALQTKALLAELFADWKSAEKWQRLPESFRAVPAVKQVLQTPDKQNAVFRAALRIPLGDSHADYPALAIASHIIGGGFISSRLANRLRQQEGISYTVSAGLSVSRQEQIGSFTAYAIYAPQFRDKVERAFAEEMARVVRDGFTEQEIKDAKNAILQQSEMARAQDGTLAYMLVANMYYGQDLNRLRKLESAIRNLTAAEVNAALKRHLDPAGFSGFYAGDFAKNPPQSTGVKK